MRRTPMHGAMVWPGCARQSNIVVDVPTLCTPVCFQAHCRFARANMTFLLNGGTARHRRAKPIAIIAFIIRFRPAWSRRSMTRHADERDIAN